MSDESKTDREGKNSKSNEQHHTNSWLFCLKIGFFAGLIWGFLRLLFYEMKFTRELPAIMADPFFKSSFLKTGWGMVVGIACYIIFSIIATLIYRFTLGKLRGPWPGVAYGFVWWMIIFIGLGPLLHISQPITKAGWNTVSSELCVFLLWGLFIGYSIAFEFTDEASREPITAH